MMRLEEICKDYSTLESQGQTTIRSISNWLDTARDQQLTPNGEWNIWLILAGRGWGKTRTGAEDIITYAIANPNTISAGLQRNITRNKVEEWV